MLLQRPFYLLQEGDEQEAHALENSSQAVPSLKDQQRRRAGRIAPREGVSGSFNFSYNVTRNPPKKLEIRAIISRMYLQAVFRTEKCKERTDY